MRSPSLRSAISTTSGGRLAAYRSWIACCLGRGLRAPLAETDLDQLVAELGETAYPSGTFVFREGDDAARIHVLKAGRLELSRVLGGRRVALQILGPGDVFGDVPAFLGETEPADAYAIEDCCVLSLDAASLFAMLATRPHVARRWIVSLAERMASLQGRLGDLLAGSLEAQLASILLRESAEGDSDDVLLTQDQLSEMLGAARTSVHRVLKQLERDGLVEIGYRRVAVLERSALADRVRGCGVAA